MGAVPSEVGKTYRTRFRHNLASTIDTIDGDSLIDYQIGALDVLRKDAFIEETQQVRIYDVSVDIFKTPSSGESFLEKDYVETFTSTKGE